MLSNISEIHIKVKPRHQKVPKLLKYISILKEQTLKVWFWSFPFHKVSSPTFGNIFAFFLIFKRGQNEEVQRKNCAEITGRENGKKKFKLVRVQWN